jgi:hypothetical protein
VIPEWMTALAAAGGSALAGAMATDAWETTRARFARLFGRADTPQRAVIEARLDSDVTALERAGHGDRDRIRHELAAAWEARLAGLLESEPDTAHELRTAIERLGSTPTRPDVQYNMANHGGTLYSVQGGTQNVHIHHPGPDPRPPEPGANGAR